MREVAFKLSQSEKDSNSPSVFANLECELINFNVGSIWSPHLSEPAYQANEQDNILTYMYGYFDHLYASYKSRYQLPKFIEVGSKKTVRWDLNLGLDEPLMNQIKQGWIVAVSLRFCTLDLSISQDDQLLDQYIKHSRLIEAKIILT